MNGGTVWMLNVFSFEVIVAVTHSNRVKALNRMNSIEVFYHNKARISVWDAININVMGNIIEIECTKWYNRISCASITAAIAATHSDTVVHTTTAAAAQMPCDV